MIDDTREQDLASFVSDHVLAQLSVGLSEPSTSTVRGTLLLSDISGFTSRVEAVSAEGLGAVEAMNSGLADYTNRHITIVREHGGDVLDIAGDSFLCLWRSDGSNRAADQRAAGAAARAGLAIQRAIEGIELEHGHAVRTRIGLASGDIELSVVGGLAGRWELMIRGAACETVAGAERDCPVGAVAVDVATVGHLGAASQFGPLTADLRQLIRLDPNLPSNPPTEPTVLPPSEAIAGQAPRIARTLAGQTRGHWAMEFRRITVMFCNLPGLDSLDIGALHEIVSAFQEIIAKFDGDSSVVFDGKGASFVATFGAPPAAHEDDPERAIAAALGFVRAAKASAAISVGVATGRVLHGVAGNEMRRSVTIAGDVVNVASRLAGSARDQVVCDQLTASRASARYSFTVLNPISVKGRSERVPVFMPTGRANEADLRLPTVRGRERESELIVQPIDVSRSDHHTSVVLGEAGIGKSALASSFSQHARGLGLAVLVARADPIDRSAPYGAWVAVVRSILGMDRDAGAAIAVQLAESKLPNELAEQAPLLADLFGAPTDNEHTVGLSRDQRSRATAKVIAELVELHADRSVLIVEDAHWFDSVSWVVLHAILDRTPTLPMLITSRHTNPDLDRIVGDPTCALVELLPLGRQPMLAMLGDRLGVDSVPDALTDFVFERTNGNPFFCDELVKNLLEQGTVTVSRDRVIVGNLAASEVPSTVEGVVVSRFDRLDPDEQRCLKAAAVVGQFVDADVVEFCLGSEMAGPLLDQLVANGMLIIGEEGLQFRHVIARDVVVGLMTQAQRGELHRAAAIRLEQRLPVSARAVGNHWLSAGEPERAAAHFESAAADALRSGGFAEARSLYDQLTNIATIDAARVAAIRLDRAVACYYLGLVGEVRSDIEAAIAVLDRPLPTDDDGRRHETRRRLFGRYATQLRRVEPHQREIQESLLSGYQRLTQVMYLVGAPPLELQVVALRALRLAERVGSADMVATSCGLLAGISGMLADRKQLERYSARATGLVASGRVDRVASEVWRFLCAAHAGQGEWDAAIAASDRAEAARGDDVNRRDAGLWQLRASIHLCAGDFASADRCWRRAADIAKQTNNRRQAYLSRLDHVHVLVGQDRLDDADFLLIALNNEYGTPEDPLHRIKLHYSLALVCSARRQHSKAIAAAETVIEMVEAVPPSGFHWVEFCSGVVEVYLTALFATDRANSSEWSAIADRTNHSIELLDQLSKSFPHVVPRVLSARGLMAAVEGQPLLARQSLVEARVAAERANLRYDAARISALLVMLRVESAGDQLTRARQLFQDLGAERWLRLTANVAH